MSVFDINAYRERWDKGIRLDAQKDVLTNFLDELEEYSKLPRKEVERLFYHGTEVYAEEWEKKYKDDPEARIKFYDESFTHIFFVMHNSAIRTENSSPLLYLYALDWAKRLKAKKYLDYGAGTGSGAAFFSKEGIDTTVADISNRMLDFTKWRFEKRGLKATYFDAKVEQLPEKTFDMITCFHVLQHVEDPVRTMRQLRNALREGGILIVNGALQKDPDRPMQPDHGGANTRRKFRSVGLQKLWEPISQMQQLSNTTPQAYQRVERPYMMNLIYLFYDSVITSLALRKWAYNVGTFVTRLFRWDQKPKVVSSHAKR